MPEFVEWPAERKPIQECLARWKSAVAKADILTGGRGKAGLVETVDSLSEAIRALKRLSAVEHRGRLARTAYLVQHVPAQHEVYTAITYDSRYLSPAITLSLRGGMDVESIPDSEKRTFPVDVYQGLDAYQAGELLEALQCPRPVISPLARALVNLWDMFITSGMKMCEVNPWRITPDNRPRGLRLQGRLRRGELQAPQPGTRSCPSIRRACRSSRRRWTAGTPSRTRARPTSATWAAAACCRSCSAAGPRRSSSRR